MITVVVFVAIILAVTWMIGIAWSRDEGINRKVMIAILSVITLVAIVALFWFSTTAAGRRAVKSSQSNLTGGLPRKVEVYSMDGKLIKEYQGTFDIDYDENRVIFDDEKGKRHVIYYPTGTVIVDELED